MSAILRRTTGHLFGRYLLLTNTVSSGGLMAVGDLSVQVIEQSLDKDLPKVIDWSRTGRMLCCGLVFGPMGHGWYKVLDRYLPLTTPSTVVKKILLEQLSLSPIGNGLFFFMAGRLEGKSDDETWRELKQKFWTIYKMEWSFWVPVQWFNFYYLQPKYRVLYVSVAATFWDAYLSYAKHNEKLGCKET